jgi:hypothetical protein
MRAETRNRLWSAMLWTALAAVMVGIAATAGAFDASVLLPVMSTGGTPIPAVAWYKLDGNALDSSGNGYHGTWTGTEAYVTGKYGQAGSYDGSSGVSTPGETIIPAGSVTVAAWAKLDRHIDFQAIAGAGILSKGNGIGLLGAASSWTAQNREGTVLHEASTNHSSTTAWTHLATVRNGTDLRLYVNGVLSAVTASANVAAADARFAIGERYRSMLIAFRLDGLVDDVRIYDRALSQDNIQRIMTGQTVEPIEELQ